VSQATEQRRRERLQEYETALAATRPALATLALFVQARESRANGTSLEEEFAATPLDNADPFPAAIWVALRQDDIHATLDLLVRLSGTEFLIAAHEQLDDTYRLTTVDETRAVPEVEKLVVQLSAFLQIPADVMAVVAGWGPDDARTAAEIDALLGQRFGPPTATAAASTPRHAEDPAADRPDGDRRPTASPPAPAGRPTTDGIGLRMSAAEFGALLSLTPEQCTVLASLVRQTTITVDADG
jgi:hypothetical protein